ncbi:MAG TPA: hypothetical protein PKJ99_06885 [Thermoanaerobaculales bacterium]|nr:hypothetical protein [Thermoanaerobaculales bacterium]HPA80359.1 hypothetical protein [Thermoanaerobaculales bacterium]HQL29033.1 hypothetical protein [Thermoanaerobaculales bacterium]HQN97026.1 hypothetical protein [Thermoanaerobaculales bacterium]HQP42030.1 hypothetical protein [Thermoanaerobaculales bacterium]
MNRTRIAASFGFLVIALAVAVALISAGPAAADRASSSSSGSMRWMIVTSHTPEKCLADLDAVMASKPEMLNRIEWGCKSGDHTGYVVVDASSEQAARQMLPAPMQATARVIRLNRFTADEIRAFHQTMK